MLQYWASVLASLHAVSAQLARLVLLLAQSVSAALLLMIMHETYESASCRRRRSCRLANCAVSRPVVRLTSASM